MTDEQEGEDDKRDSQSVGVSAAPNFDTVAEELVEVAHDRQVIIGHARRVDPHGTVDFAHHPRRLLAHRRRKVVVHKQLFFAVLGENAPTANRGAVARSVIRRRRRRRHVTIRGRGRWGRRKEGIENTGTGLSRRLLRDL